MARDPEKAERLAAQGRHADHRRAWPAQALRRRREGHRRRGLPAYESSPRGVALDKQALETMLGAQVEASQADGKPPQLSLHVRRLGAGPHRQSRRKRMRRSIRRRTWRGVRRTKTSCCRRSRATLRTVVIRPGIVYGGGRGIVSDLIKDALNGLVRVVGPGKNRWACVYDHDLGDLYVRDSRDADSPRGFFMPTDEADERVSDIVEAIAAQVPQRPDIRYMPMAEARKKFGTYADALALDQKVRSPKARALGWAPTQAGVISSVARLVEDSATRSAKEERRNELPITKANYE